MKCLDGPKLSFKLLLDKHHNGVIHLLMYYYHYYHFQVSDFYFKLAKEYEIQKLS
jgi:hypothetical protein